MKAPPAWATRLLGLALPKQERASVLADLQELYARRAERYGVGAARRWYARHSLVFVARLGAEWAKTTARTAPGGGDGMGGLVRELGAGVRRLVRAPVFAVVSVLTIGAGIGAFASVFAVVDAVLLEKPGYEEPDELVWIWRRYWFGLERGWLGGPDVVGLRAHDDVFEDVVAFRSGSLNLTGRTGVAPRSVRTLLASSGFFDLLGVDLPLGRGFRSGEDAPGAAQVAVLSHDLWQAHFGGDPGVVGSDVYLDGSPVRVVGVAPRDFHFVKHTSLGDPVAADLYVPLRMDLASLDSGSGMFAGLARVRDGVTTAQVHAAVDAVASDIDATWGNPGLEMWWVRLQEDLVSPVRPALLALLASASFLLLILAANLATLLLGRATLRDRELAVRAALGAGLTRLLQTVLLESAVLATAGAVVGVGLTFAGVDLVRRLAPPDLPRLWALDVNGMVVVAALAVTGVMTAAAGLVPALASVSSGVAERLRETGTRSGGGVRRARTRSALVVAQVALSLMLLVGAGLLARAFHDLTRSDPGFDGEGTLTFEVPLDPASYGDAQAILEFEARFRDALAALPGVEAVGAADVLPLQSDANQRPVTFPDSPANTGDQDEDEPLVDWVRLGPGYAEAVGLRVLRGRALRPSDRGDGEGVALIDDLLARRFYPEADPVGATLITGGVTLRVVGVVDHARLYNVHSDDRPQVYVPMEVNPTATLFFVVRASGDARALAPAVRDVLEELDPQLPLTAVRPMDEIVRGALGRERLSLTLLGAFALGAMLLAALGLYGVVGNTVTRRTHEMGVRMALGADRRRVLRMVVGQGLRLTALGLAVGIGGALALAPGLETVAVGLRAADPWVYLAVVSGLVLVGVVASFAPAHRATRIDPVEALKAE